MRINQQSSQKRVRSLSALITLFVFVFLGCSQKVRAQWATNGNNINNTNSGNVGIGTASPGTLNGNAFSTVKLHTSNSSSSAYSAVESTSAGAVAGMLLNLSYANANNRMWSVEALPASGNTTSQFAISTYTDAGFNTARLSIDRSGNVGIGTTSPTQTLHVIGKTLIQNTGTAALFIVDRTDGKIASLGAGGTSATFAYDESGIFKIESNSRSNISSGVFGAGATSRFTIDGSGNVGIGTASPGYKLDVAGEIRSSTGGFRFPDGSLQTTAASGGGGRLRE